MPDWRVEFLAPDMVGRAEFLFDEGKTDAAIAAELLEAFLAARTEYRERLAKEKADA